METVSHYQILEKLGEGGMGEVYLVSDTKLSRKAALKILPAKLAVDRKHLNRFLQEARLAATLNHPNICTVYEINEQSDTPFIAMEYVEGRTLAEMLDGSRAFEFGDVVEIAVQVADALDEAHRHGIIHRDIKAHNIIVNKRGRVKVLDFGLAKSFETETSEQEVTRAKTESGMLVGTVQYMSPEQALGKELDPRTDLWSLGVLLYELTTGQLPFKGATVAATFNAILHEEPILPSELALDLPPALEQIILRLLEKDRELRYQTASDLRADLKRLQRSSSVSVRRVTGDALANSAAVRGLKKDSSAPKRTDSVQVKATQPSLQVASGSRSFIYAGVGLLILLGLLTAGYFIYSNKQNAVTAQNFRQNELERLTNYGKISDAVISSDGKYMAYALDDSGSESLWLKQLGTNTKLQLVAPSNVSFQGLAISPDSNWVYYNIWDKKSVGQIWRVPTIGGTGTPQKVVHDCMPGVSVSPDGKRLAFVRSSDERQKTLFLTANANDGSDERELITSQKQNFGFSAAAWSPDGNTIAMSGFNSDASGQPTGFIVEVPATGGEPKTLWSAPNFFISKGLAWLPDRKGFLFTAFNPQQSISQIWQVSLETGETRQITKDYNNYGNLSITADSKSLVTTQQDFSASVWVVPADNPQQARRVTNGKLEGLGASWTAENKIVYGSTLSGGFDLWLTDPDGANQRQLTKNGAINTQPCAFANGERIAFVSNAGNNSLIPQVWQMNLKTGDTSQMTKSEGAFAVICSYPNDFVYSASVNYTENSNIWQTFLTGDSKPLKIKNALNYRPAVSPDGKQLAYVFWDEKEKRLAQEILTFATGETKRFQLPLTAIRGVNQPEIILGWTADGKGISYISDEKEVSNVWTQPLDGGKPKKITDFKENYILYFSWSPDGKYLAVTRGIRSNDAVLIKSEN